jgi:hypothetical protein
MSEHQESLKQVVARIEASFVRIKSYGEKLDQFRISAGKQLVELKVRIEAGEAGNGVKWWAWYAENFENRTRRDAQKVMALANADNPEEAAEKERAKNRAAVAAHRERAAEAEKHGRLEDASYRKTQSHGSDLPDDAAADERAAHWAEEMLLRIEADCRDEDVDRELGFKELSYRLASALGFKVHWIPWSEERIAAAESPASRRGRPPGSKNKPKDPRAQAAAEPSAPATEEQLPTPPAASAKTEIPKDLSIPSFMDRTHQADARS